jgi:hypothetical protein
MDSTIKKSVKRQREVLKGILGGFLASQAKKLAFLMNDPGRLNDHLTKAISNLPYCKYIYVLDVTGKQISGTVKHGGIKLEDVGRDRSERPYMANMFNAREGNDFELSGAYISKNKNRPSLTGIQLIRDEGGNRLGFLGVDYDLRELPRSDKMYDEPLEWRQIKGDPAIRGGLFLQQRVESQMDQHLKDVMTILEELILHHGVYHCQIHYSSSRVTVWHVDDPYTYRILTMDELSDSEVCLAYPKRPYFERNVVPQNEVCNVFKQFSALRFADETIYLRSGSLNLVNGFIGLNFSCDGTHYLMYDDFLGRGLDFWFGTATDGSEIASATKDVKNDVAVKKEGIDMNAMDALIEDIAQRGCLEVNQVLLQLDAGEPPEALEKLEVEERQYIHDELKSVMAVYEGEVCSI